MSNQTTFVWLTLSGAVFSAIAIFVVGFLVGLCCGKRSSGKDHEQRQTANRASAGISTLSPS